MLRIVTFKLEEELLEKVDKYAKEKNMTRSDVIRIALKKLVMTDE